MTKSHDPTMGGMPMFASKTVAAHLVRGVIAAALITWALLHQSSDPVFAVAAGVVAMVAMKGCPLCWTLGLVETIGERIKGGRAHTSAPECRSCS